VQERNYHTFHTFPLMRKVNAATSGMETTHHGDATALAHDTGR
jgi:hypothetical protein